MSSSETFCIQYRFAFPESETIEVPVLLAARTLALVREGVATPPAWTALAVVNCTVCPLARDTHSHCPVAVHLSELVMRFATHYSYEKVMLTVTTPERTISAATSLQAALSSLAGIYMVTAGCPVMDHLRPMVRFHLPLATEHETVYRAVSMYLLGQYLRHQQGLSAEFSLDGLEAIYRDVHQVNRAIAKAVRAAAAHDAHANALVRLDLFGEGVKRSTQERLADLRYLFMPSYLPPDSPPGSPTAP